MLKVGVQTVILAAPGVEFPLNASSPALIVNHKRSAGISCPGILCRGFDQMNPVGGKQFLCRCFYPVAGRKDKPAHKRQLLLQFLQMPFLPLLPRNSRNQDATARSSACLRGAQIRPACKSHRLLGFLRQSVLKSSYPNSFIIRQFPALSITAMEGSGIPLKVLVFTIE